MNHKYIISLKRDSHDPNTQFSYLINHYPDGVLFIYYDTIEKFIDKRQCDHGIMSAYVRKYRMDKEYGFHSRSWGSLGIPIVFDSKSVAFEGTEWTRLLIEFTNHGIEQIDRFLTERRDIHTIVLFSDESFVVDLSNYVRNGRINTTQQADLEEIISDRMCGLSGAHGFTHKCYRLPKASASKILTKEEFEKRFY